MRLSAAECGRVRQSAAECGRVWQSATECDRAQHSAEKRESCYRSGARQIAITIKSQAHMGMQQQLEMSAAMRHGGGRVRQRAAECAMSAAESGRVRQRPDSTQRAHCTEPESADSGGGGGTP